MECEPIWGTRNNKFWTHEPQVHLIISMTFFHELRIVQTFGRAYLSIWLVIEPPSPKGKAPKA
jgi:hypothetical protein